MPPHYVVHWPGMLFEPQEKENNKFRERITLEWAGPVNNHEQTINVLRYSTKAWRIGEEAAFHEELGYWSWEPSTLEAMKFFLVPRGVSVIAGGKANKNAREFTLVAHNGSNTYGVCSNPFLDKEFKVVKYEITVKLIDENTFSYASDTVIQMPGMKELFHHTDSNTLKRVE